MRYVLLITLCLSLLACDIFRPIHASQIPHIGWTRRQVDLALKDSLDVSYYGSGYEVRRYGISTGIGSLQSWCGKYTRTCITVYLRDGQVIEVVQSPWY